MAQGFTPYSGGSFGSSPGGFSGAGAGSFPATSNAPRTTKATTEPVFHLAPSLLLGVVGIVLNAVITFGDHVATDTTYGVLALIAWFLAGVLGISLLGWYFLEVNKRRGAGFYIKVGWKKAAAWVTFAVLSIAVLWSAIDIALWVGKL